MFKQFPKLSYDMFNDGSEILLTDIWRSVQVNDFASRNSIAYLNYDVTQGTRPDQLSQEVYGSPDFWWVPFIINESLKDGLNAWPKDSSVLDEEIDDLYGDLGVIEFLPTPDGRVVESTDASDIYNAFPSPTEDFVFTEDDYLLLTAEDEDSNMSYDSQLMGQYMGRQIQGWDYDRYQMFVKSDARIRYILNYDPALETDYNDDWQKYSGDKSDRYFFGDGAKNVDFWLQDASQYVFRRYSMFSSNAWANSKNAPYRYFDLNGSEITAYDTITTAHTTQSYEEYLIEENDSKRTIRVVAPDRVRTFAKDFFALINR